MIQVSVVMLLVNCLRLVIFSSKPGVDQKIVLHASSDTMNYTKLISTFPLIPIYLTFFQLLSPLSSQRGNVVNKLRTLC